MIGIDIVKIERIRSVLNRKGAKFIEYIASAKEREDLSVKNNGAETVAGYFAAKEAMAKALGVGIGKAGLRKLEVCHHQSGQPYGKYKNQRFRLSISHEHDYAIAVAILESGQLQIPEELEKIFPKVSTEDHKGSRGRAGIIAGSMGMLGSAYLSTSAALRMGSGYAYNLVDEEILPLMSLKFIEEIVVSTSPKDKLQDFIGSLDSLAVGPGIGTSDSAREKLAISVNFDGPLVIDADGLNLLSENLSLLEEREPFSTILTPHPGEFRRLSGLSMKEISGARARHAREFARKHQVILVLKGANTVVTNGEDVYINQTGNPGLATAGSGDVLTGMITGLLAQKVGNFDAAKLGVAIHGLCGDYLLHTHSPNGILAHDLVEVLPMVTKLFYI